MNARPKVSRASRIGLVYVTSNDEPANEADAGIALRDWPLPPVKPFPVIFEETQADARSIVRGTP